MHDIVGTMFNKRFMEELFKPQDTYSKKAMRTVFDRLAHASIMRLNSASMDKVNRPTTFYWHTLQSGAGLGSIHDNLSFSPNQGTDRCKEK